MNKYIDQGKVLKLMRDIVFKNVLKDTNNREFLAKIISIATKIDYIRIIKIDIALIKNIRLNRKLTFKVNFFYTKKI